jgi:hypothetical protein
VPLAIYAATTGGAEWNTRPPAVPERFTVEIFEQVVAFGPLRLPVTSRNSIGRDVVGIIAADEDVTVVLERLQLSDTWRWQLSGEPGQAFGYMTATRQQ